MVKLAIIGGTGLTSLNGLEITQRQKVQTPFGDLSGSLTHGLFQDREVVFLARHGYKSNIPPHKVNYRANIWALHHVGVESVIAVNAVGSIRADLEPGRVVVPDQIIDYTWCRRHTFFDGDDLHRVVHIDFTEPYCPGLRKLLVIAGRESGKEVASRATYGATQGPRLETAVEVDRLERDGCDIVGMTGMPEASLARELGLCYASCAVVANAAAGRGEGEISMEEIEANLTRGMERVRGLLEKVIPLI